MGEPERRGSRPRALERSYSYSEAIGNESRRSSIQIPSMINTDVYTNEELKKHYRISQTYVEGKEITFPSTVTNVDTRETTPSTSNVLGADAQSQTSSEDETGGLVLTIDVETEQTDSGSRRTEPKYSDMSTQIVASSIQTDNIYDRIDMVDSSSMYGDCDTIGPSAAGYSTPYSRRKKSAMRRRQHGRPIRSRRVVHKSGEENVPMRTNIPAKRMKYMRDVVNTVINSKWRFLILLVIVSHFIFWLFFATIWFLVSQSYAEELGDGRQHCVNGTDTFAGLLMMSVETQMTIGYGIRFPNEECPEAIIVMVVEIVAGTAMTGGLSSLLFAKLFRPNRHVTLVGFSKKAIVCLRDGELVLQFRVWDLLNLHIISTNITAYLMKPIRTLEGEFVNNYIHQLKLTQANVFLLWPVTVVHVIDSESPLYDFSAQDMMDYRFEIVVCLTGSSKNMGTVTQSRTSYLSKEIIWGYRFKDVLKYSKSKESYIIDVDNLDTVEQVDSPLCSASRFKEFKEDIKSSRDILSTPNISMTNVSMTNTSQDDESQIYESLPSSPSLSRKATQRSFGWNFRRFQPENYVGQKTIIE